MFYYSHIGKTNSFSERFSWVLTLKMDFEYRKMPIFKGVASNRFTRYQKILWACLLGCKKVLNFICLPMKFHYCHHAGGYYTKISNYDWNLVKCREVLKWSDTDLKTIFSDITCLLAYVLRKWGFKVSGFLQICIHALKIVKFYIQK